VSLAAFLILPLTATSRLFSKTESEPLMLPPKTSQFYPIELPFFSAVGRNVAGPAASPNQC